MLAGLRSWRCQALPCRNRKNRQAFRTKNFFVPKHQKWSHGENKLRIENAAEISVKITRGFGQFRIETKPNNRRPNHPNSHTSGPGIRFAHFPLKRFKLFVLKRQCLTNRRRPVNCQSVASQQVSEANRIISGDATGSVKRSGSVTGSTKSRDRFSGHGYHFEPVQSLQFF